MKIWLSHLLLLIIFSTTCTTGCSKTPTEAPPIYTGDDNQSGEEGGTPKDSVTKMDGDNVDFLKQFVVGIYVAPPIANTTEEDYQNIRAANVDLIQDISVERADREKIAMLEMADKYNLKMIVANHRVDEGKIKEMVNLFNKYPATVGYYVKDEPLATELQDYAGNYYEILQYDSTVWPHLNLLPNYATGALHNVEYVDGYVEKWIRTIGTGNIKYLSIDNYPYVVNGSDDLTPGYRWNDYYKNLDILRQMGLKYNIRTSFYLESVGSTNGDIRRPDENELRFSAYSSLAYGVTIPIWFTYWQPSFDFTTAIVSTTGSKTDLYEPFKRINAEMKILGKTLIHLKAHNVYHTGKMLPEEMIYPGSGFPITPKDLNSELIITDFTDDDSGNKYVMIVNKNLESQLQIAFDVADGVYDVKRISKETGYPVSTNFNPETRQFFDLFLPGEGNLYLVEN